MIQIHDVYAAFLLQGILQNIDVACDLYLPPRVHAPLFFLALEIQYNHFLPRSDFAGGLSVVWDSHLLLHVYVHVCVVCGDGTGGFSLAQDLYCFSHFYLHASFLAWFLVVTVLPYTETAGTCLVDLDATLSPMAIACAEASAIRCDRDSEAIQHRQIPTIAFYVDLQQVVL